MITIEKTYILPITPDPAMQKELGISVSVCDCHVWYIAYDHNQIAGFAGIKYGKTHAVLKRAYVYPAFRGRGVYRLLLQRRIEDILALGVKRIKCTVTAMSEREFISRSFRVTKEYKLYKTMEKHYE